MNEEFEISQLAYKLAQERLRARPAPFGGDNAPLPHRKDVSAEMDAARAQFKSKAGDGDG